MKTTFHTPWRVRLEIALWRHGSAGLAVLVGLLIAATLMAWLLLETRSNLAQTRRALALAVNPVQNMQAPTPGNGDAATLDTLRAALAASPAPDEVVREMAALSHGLGIEWAQGEFRSQAHAHTQTTQWQVTQPALATYPQLRQLIDAVLRAHPNVSLDQLSVQRDDTTQAQVKVRLRWSIWTLGEAPQR